MGGAGVKFVMAADVIEMTVAGNGRQRLFSHQRYMFPQADNPHTAIDKRIPVATADMPDIAAIKGLDMGLVNQGYVIPDFLNPIPVIGSYANHRSLFIYSGLKQTASILLPSGSSTNAA